MAGPKPGQKTVLITGCTPGGIGHALCLEYHHRGLYVIATARRPEVLAGLAEMGMSALQLDVTDQDSIERCEKEVAALTGGKLDILVNNAGLAQIMPATDIALPNVRRLFETNVLGTMATVQAFAGPLVAARGLVVNFASLAAVLPYVFGAAFSASKGAVVSYSRTLRQELAPFGVRVTVVMAGTVRTTIDDGRRSQTLPPGSLYGGPARDLFRWRLGYSQGASAMEARTFARRLVHDTLKPEYNVVLRGLLGWGRPDWFWYGGNTLAVRAGLWFGEWLRDIITKYSFRMNELETRLKDVERQKKLN
ncbi:short chain dehydrogenase [Apiospora sp. TS-2023a]